MLNIRKGLAVGLVTALAGAALAACGTAKDTNGTAKEASGTAKETSNAKGPTEIQFYFTGSQNVKELWDQIIPMFEKTNKNVKVKEVYIPSGTGAQSTLDRIVAAKQAGKGSGDIDLYEGSLGDITKGQKEDIWDNLDKKFQNLSNINPQDMKDVSNLAVPYRASAVVLAYNGDKVKDVPNSLDELYDWIRKHPQRFAYNDPSTGGSGSSFVQTAIYKFLPEDATHNADPAIMKQWDKGIELLKDLGKYSYGKGIYPKKNQGTLDLLANGEVDMIPAWSDMALEQIDKGTLPKSTKLKQLSPGFTGGPSYLIVPKLSEKKEAVYQFLNYILTPEAQEVVISKMHGFPGVQLSSMPKNVQDEFKGVAEGYRNFNIGDLGNEINKRWQQEVAAQ